MRIKLDYKNITEVFGRLIKDLKTLPKSDMCFAKPADYSELVRNNESAWQIYLLWRELCQHHRTTEDDQRLMLLAKI